MTLREKYHQHNSAAFFLDKGYLKELQRYLQANSWLARDGEVSAAGKAGDGNMNCVLRVVTDSGTMIVKQSRPWVEKFPTIEAPPERAIIEGQFYQLIQLNKELSNVTPKLLGFDVSASILVLEDLGNAADFIAIYKKGVDLLPQQIDELTHILSVLHENCNVHTTNERIFNRAMRRLNHEHIFRYPFVMDNGLDLDQFSEGLQLASLPYKTDAAFIDNVRALGGVYLKDGDYLLHGDFYPGSWLNTKNGIKIIDPEFCFFGTAEFELGVFIAHLYLAQQPSSIIQRVLNNYRGYTEPNVKLLINFVGIEIMRRLIGIAQLPLDLNLQERTDLLAMAYKFIMKPTERELYKNDEAV